MDNLYTALTLSLISRNKCFAISHIHDDTEDLSTDYSSIVSNSFTTNVLINQCNFTKEQIAIIDLSQVHTTIDLIQQMTYIDSSDNHTYLKNIILWQNVQHLSLAQHKSLYKLMLQLDQYEANPSENYPISISIEDRELEIYKPELFTIILILDYKLYHNKLYIYLKEKFWFSINYVINVDSTQEYSAGKRHESYQQYILDSRKKLQQIFIAPDIKKYIYSLIVHIRCHRLASLSPKSVRVPTMTIDYVSDMCKALLVYKEVPEMYLTPDYVKIAMRKIGYWLVDWEYNEKFCKENDDDEYYKRLEISMLTGDWFGSDYFYANEYIKHSRAKVDKESPTGFTNRIVEDVLTSVRPPL
ncbi:uncharacterized protein SPAPADRAFT_63270 [Spathaspora passalidarum NRRL Y-27907]|uniref:Uncharacterized protein n=1 Tax=Spathaspora passalidarum (strain NRRL Y-27907 / 11-Y1) TaxID=619300 RepID=G3AU48_SPAPN|nr:uncharacterized protein SPAPADRAFT_63270 [Spathaspora passalidarum NRRL Y-27907]EGW30424.1 hypothetical protein SPAPADRAFT_63270 [Spathaspora passalidarum NRRL Y-27907]